MKNVIPLLKEARIRHEKKRDRLQVLRRSLYCLETEVSDDDGAGKEQRKEVGMLYSISC